MINFSIDPFLIISIILGFLAVFLSMPYWIRQCHNNNLVGRDMHKQDKRKVAEGGGIIVLFGISLGILFYIAFNVFFLGLTERLVYIFALLSVILISSIVGIVDDLLGWKKGLSIWIRLLIISFAAVPLMVVNAGISRLFLPLIGAVNFGLFYPLLLIPLGIVGATTTFNFIAGYNGLETRQGILILSALAIITYIRGDSWLSVIAVITVAALIAFYFFNKYPSKVFPGDVLTYSIGALIAGIAILGSIEKIAVFIFIPYILETILKLKGKLRKESFAKLNEDGSLKMPYKKVYGLEHLAIKILKKRKTDKKVYEKDVVNFINIFQIIIILIAFLLFIF